MSGFLGGVDGAVRAWSANRKQNTIRAVGGTLSLMPDSLLFKPHAIDAALAGQTWQVHLSQIRAVGREGANFGELFSGGLASRLRVDFWDGTAELFNVWGLDEVINTLNSYLAWYRQQNPQGPGQFGLQGAGQPAVSAPPVPPAPGQPALSATPIPPAPGLICPGCGAPMAPTHKFCGQCGRPAGQ
jgi:hypothetical protein